MYENAFFSWERFVKLMKQEWEMNRQRLLMSLGIILAAGFAYAWYRLSTDPEQFERIMRDGVPSRYAFMPHDGYFKVLLFFMVGLAMLIGQSFYWPTKHQYIRYLMVPASSFEKYLSAFLIRFVGGFLVTLLLFWVSTNLARLVIELTPRYAFAAERGFAYQPFGYGLFLDPEYGFGKHLWINLFAILSVGAFFFVVPLFFKKLALLKTSLLFFVVLFGMLFLLVGLSHLFIPETKGFEILLYRYHLSSTMNASLFMNGITVYSAFPVLLLIGYFKLKERTV